METSRVILISASMLFGAIVGGLLALLFTQPRDAASQVNPTYIVTPYNPHEEANKWCLSGTVDKRIYFFDGSNRIIDTSQISK